MIQIYGQFIDIQLELGTFKRYMDTVKNQLPGIERMELDRMLATLREMGWQVDPDGIDSIYREVHDIVEHVMHRFFRSTLLVALWGIYESAILDVASYLKTQKDLVVDIDQFKGNLLKRAKLYFEHILNFPLHLDPQIWEVLETFYLLRNAIAHSNGRLGALNKTVRNKIIQLEQANIGISIHSDSILISKDYLGETYSIVDASLQDLITRASLEYPPPGQRHLRPV